MDEFSGINAFFNMIYHHDRAFSRALLDYQSFNDYRQWLRNHHIEFKELDMIDEYSFSMIRPDMTIKDVSMLTHTNLQEGLQRIRSFFKDKTFLFLIIVGLLSMISNVVVNLSLAVISTPNNLSYLQLFSLSIFQILLISTIIYFIFSKLIRNYFYQNNQILIDFRQIILSKWPSILLILSILYFKLYFNL